MKYQPKYRVCLNYGGTKLVLCTDEEDYWFAPFGHPMMHGLTTATQATKFMNGEMRTLQDLWPVKRPGYATDHIQVSRLETFVELL